MTISNFLAPSLLNGFNTIGIDELRGIVGFNRVPPDHNGVVGPNHVVSVFNHALQVYDKSGGLVSTQTLDSLFGAIGGTTVLPVDPNILYDASADRYVYVSFEVTGFNSTINPANDQVLLNVAVSKTNDPTQGWHVAQINAKTSINGVNGWSDFPGIAVDGEAIYITANMFGFDASTPFLGNRIWIIDKGDGAGGLYDGGGAAFSVHDPVAEATDLTGLGVVEATLMPARIEGLTAGASGIYLVAADGIVNGANEIAQIIRIEDPLGSPTFTAQSLNLGNISVNGALPSATQRGTNTQLGSGDARVWSGAAVEFDGKLYFAFDVAPNSGPDAGEVTVHWVQVDATNPTALSLIQQGNVGGENIAPGTHTFMPSIAVNKDGSVLLNFSASGPSIYPGAYYALRADGDPAGQFGPAQTLAPGLDHYFRTRAGEGISSQTINRWGDFSGASVDPVDGTTFWFFNMFADTRGSPNSAGQDGRWRLTIGSARPTITNFEHADGDADEHYVGGIGTDGLRILADLSGSNIDITRVASGDFLVAFGGGGVAQATSIENIFFIGSNGADVVTFGDGISAALLAGGAFDARGGGGADLLIGGALADRLFGEAGADTLIGGGGGDTLHGGGGFDLVSYAASGAGVFIRLGTNVGLSGHAQGDSFTSVEAISGTAFRDILVGDANSNALFGGDGDDDLWGLQSDDTLAGENGNDLLIGASGDDLIFGGADADTLSGGSGADTLNGGAGTDLVTYFGAANGIFLRLDTGAGFAGQATGEMLAAIENVRGTDHRDIIVGDALGNSISGEGGDDDIYGGDGDDTLFGDGGNDILFGQLGADVLAGGGGEDTLTGGNGDDSFVFSIGDGADSITDFVLGMATDDVIQLNGFGAAFDSFTEVLAASSQAGADVVIDFGGGDAITLHNVMLANLHQDDFVFG